MTKSKKYDYKVEQQGSTWSVQIIRKASKNKNVISKQQDDFTSVKEAKAWGEEQLLEFSSTMAKSNQRHGEHRKANDEAKRQRAIRRAEKTKALKEQQAVAKQLKAENTEQLQTSMDFGLD